MSSGKKDFSLFHFALILMIIWVCGFVLFVLETERISELKNQKDWPKNTHGAVLTGGEKRVELGINLLQKNDLGRLFVSGVGSGVTVRDLLQANDIALGKEFSGKLWLGYEATSTVGNATEIADYMKKNDQKKIVIITSAYHMPRAILELKKYVEQENIYPYSVDYKNLANAPFKYFSEYNKYLLSQLRHFIAG